MRSGRATESGSECEPLRPKKWTGELRYGITRRFQRTVGFAACALKHHSVGRQE